MTLLNEILESMVDRSKTMTKDEFTDYYKSMAGMCMDDKSKEKILKKGEELLKFMR